MENPLRNVKMFSVLTIARSQLQNMFIEHGCSMMVVVVTVEMCPQLEAYRDFRRI